MMKFKHVKQTPGTSAWYMRRYRMLLIWLKEIEKRNAAKLKFDVEKCEVRADKANKCDYVVYGKAKGFKPDA